MKIETIPEETIHPDGWRMIKLSAKARHQLGTLRDIKEAELGTKVTLRATLEMLVHEAFKEAGGE